MNIYTSIYIYILFFPKHKTGSATRLTKAITYDEACCTCLSANVFVFVCMVLVKKLIGWRISNLMFLFFNFSSAAAPRYFLILQ